MSSASDAVSALTGYFLTLMAIANPIGSGLIFDQASSQLAPRDQRTVARRVAVSVALVLIAAMLSGTIILDALGITLSALRVAGGLILGWNAWRLVVDEPKPAALETNESMSSVFVPLTVPITIGPGTIAAAIAIGSPRSFSWSSVSHTLLAIVAVLILAAVIYFVYGHARRITSSLGQAGASAATRVSAFILLCVAAEMLLHGLRDSLRAT